MNLIVDIHNKIVKIILLEGKNEKDEIEIEEFNNLSEKLLANNCWDFREKWFKTKK